MNCMHIRYSKYSFRKCLVKRHIGFNERYGVEAMTHITETLQHTGSPSYTLGWAEQIASWYHARKARKEHDQRLVRMLSLNDHLLDDIGLSRQDLLD